MTTSTWNIYKSCNILPDKNFIVDSLEDYLSTLTKETISKMQYIKHGLSISVDINKTQASLDFFNDTYNYNYISIQNAGEDTYPVYYFILRKVWLSSGAIRFILKMDTLNTFTISRGNYVISNKTLVDREHKDRFGLFMEYGSTADDGFVGHNVIFDRDTMRSVWSHLYFDHANVTIKIFDNLQHKFIEKETFLCAEIENFDDLIKIYGYDNDDNVVLVKQYNWYDTPDTTIFSWYSEASYDSFECPEIEDDVYKMYGAYFTTKVKRIVHMYSEGLTPILLKQEDIVIHDSKLGNINWYLVYKNRDDVNPSQYNQVNPVECFICADNPINVAYTGGNVISVAQLQDGKIYYIRKPTWDESAVTPNDIEVEDDNGITRQTFISNAVRQMIYFYKSGNDIVWGLITGSSGFSWSAVYEEVGKTKYLIPDTNPCLVGVSTSLIEHVTQTDYESATTESYMTLASASVQIDGIDDVDRTSSKMIKIIKLPYCPINLTKSGGVYQFDSSKFEYKATDEITAIAFKDLNMSLLKDVETTNLNPYYELEDIDFTGVVVGQDYQEKFESKLFHSDYYQPKLVYDSFSYTCRLEYADLYWDIPRLLKFKFKVTTTINSKFLFQFNDTPLTYAVEDFEKTLPVARNNELALYNNQYINYLKNAFNYDVKSKNRQEFTSVVGTGLQLVGAIASFASSGVTGGMGIATGIGLLTSTTMNAVNTANTIAQSEQNIQAKITQTKAQSTNVSGSDDVDLMSYYSGNRLRKMLYTLSPKMKKAMLDVFHYNGYISGEMKVPNLTGRLWFNFVRCDIVFSEVVNIPDECLEDLKSLFKDGVTILHKYFVSWDFNREKENWENFIVEEVL